MRRNVSYALIIIGSLLTCVALIILVYAYSLSTKPNKIPSPIVSVSVAPTPSKEAEVLGVCWDIESSAMVQAYREGSTVLCPFGQFVSVYPAKSLKELEGSAIGG